MVDPRRSAAPTALAIKVLFAPLVLIGYLLVLGRIIRHSRRSGTSATLLACFYVRWMQHQLGMRRDDPCARLMAVLPPVHPLGLRLVTAPTLVAHQVTGHVPATNRYPFVGVASMIDQPAARTTFFDAVLDQHLESVDQLVVLGAGMDTRSYRLGADTSVRCFEVDLPTSQSFKVEMLRRAGVPADRVTFVPADLMQADWFDPLTGAGFDPTRPSCFLWESVTMYLDGPSVGRVLCKVAGCAPGSVIAFDYFSSGFIADGDRSVATPARS